jgi:hypothetical protein
VIELPFAMETMRYDLRKNDWKLPADRVVELGSQIEI